MRLISCCVLLLGILLVHAHPCWSATLQEHKQLGLAFNETMSGFWYPASAPGNSTADYQEAAEKGRLANMFVDFHLEMETSDLNDFLHNDAHMMTSTGSLVCNKIASSTSVTRGFFQLFITGSAPTERLMKYHLQFKGTDGALYLLEGTKYIRSDTCLHLWADLTTLYVDLIRLSDDGSHPNHKDNDAGVIGIGIMTISVPEVIKLFETIRVEGAANEIERLLAIEQFGKLFLGTLWDVCIKHVV